MKEREKILEEMIATLKKEAKPLNTHCGTGIFKHYWRMSEDCLKKYERLIIDDKKSGMLNNLKKILEEMKTDEKPEEKRLQAKKICQIMLESEKIRKELKNKPYIICK